MKTSKERDKLQYAKSDARTKRYSMHCRLVMPAALNNGGKISGREFLAQHRRKGLDRNTPIRPSSSSKAIKG